MPLLFQIFSFTFVSSKIFIPCPITLLVCAVSFTLGSHYAGSSSSSFVCASPLADCPRHVLARSAVSISRRCWDQPLRSPLAHSSQSVLVAPPLPPFALSCLSSSHPPWPGEDRDQRACVHPDAVSAKPPRCTRDACGRISRDATSPGEDTPRPTKRHQGWELIFQIAPFSSSAKFKPHARMTFHLLSRFYTCLFLAER